MKELLKFEQLPEAVQENNERLGRIEKLLINIPSPISAKINKRYTLPEAAEYCRMAVPTFRTYLAKRAVSGVKFGKSWVFTQESLDLFFQKYRVKTVDELRQEANDSVISKRK